MSRVRKLPEGELHWLVLTGRAPLFLAEQIFMQKICSTSGDIALTVNLPPVFFVVEYSCCESVS
jgi:hypothetical protein